MPLFFERDARGHPRALARARRATPWRRCRRCSTPSAWCASTPAAPTSTLAREGTALAANRSEGARTRARKKARLRELFPKIRVTEVRVSDLASVRVGDSIEVRLMLDLAQLTPAEVSVELVLGHAKPGAAPDLIGGIVEPLRCVSSGPGQTHAYEGGHKVERSGAFAYGLRVRASADLGDPIDTLRDLVRWVGSGRRSACVSTNCYCLGSDSAGTAATIRYSGLLPQGSLPEAGAMGVSPRPRCCRRRALLTVHSLA